MAPYPLKSELPPLPRPLYTWCIWLFKNNSFPQKLLHRVCWRDLLAAVIKHSNASGQDLAALSFLKSSLTKVTPDLLQTPPWCSLQPLSCWTLSGTNHLLCGSTDITLSVSSETTIYPTPCLGFTAHSGLRLPLRWLKHSSHSPLFYQLLNQFLTETFLDVPVIHLALQVFHCQAATLGIRSTNYCTHPQLYCAPMSSWISLPFHDHFVHLN